jgi:PASTA domain
MSIDTARCAGSTRGGKRSMWRALGGVAAVVLALTVAAPAWASYSASATLAPIGTGSHLLTVTNTGSETITGFFASAGEEPVPSNIVPSPACHYGNTPANATITCTITIAPGASAQMCYTGKPLVEVLPGSALVLQPQAGSVTLTTSPALSSCPLPGFKAASGGGTEKCVVPNVKGKLLASAEKAIVKAHCVVGKVKKAHSSHVKKGRVVSQGAGAGKSLPGGTKVSLVVSKGK